MTTFNYTSGAFNNLVGGTPGANVSNLVQLLNDLKAFLNNANLTDTNVTAAGLTDASLASPTNSAWRTVTTFSGSFIGSGVALTTGVFYFVSQFGIVASGANNLQAVGFWIPPTAGDVAIAGKTTRLRLRVPWVTNATAPGINISWGLYPITAAGGGAGTIAITLGTVVAGSQATVTTPAANTALTATGSSFDFSSLPASAFFIGVTGSGTQAANSTVVCQPILEMRHT